jgi:hypothetical protein
VDPTAGLGDVEKRKFLTLLRLKIRPLVIQPVANRYTDCAVISSKMSFCAVCSYTIQQTAQFIIFEAVVFFTLPNWTGHLNTSMSDI